MVEGAGGREAAAAALMARAHTAGGVWVVLGEGCVLTVLAWTGLLFGVFLYSKSLNAPFEILWMTYEVVVVIRTAWVAAMTGAAGMGLAECVHISHSSAMGLSGVVVKACLVGRLGMMAATTSGVAVHDVRNSLL